MIQAVPPSDKGGLLSQAELYRRLAEITRNRENTRRLLALAEAYEAQAEAAHN